MNHGLERFVEAQAPIYSDVTAELAGGHKESHWMWFVFPQVGGLGSSPMAKIYAIDSVDEAVAYADHPVLGPRLRECANLILSTQGRTAEDIFGSVDAMKLHSSMTLFRHAVPEDSVFGEVLDKFYNGLPDPATEHILANWPSVSAR